MQFFACLCEPERVVFVGIGIELWIAVDGADGEGDADAGWDVQVIATVISRYQHMTWS